MKLIKVGVFREERDRGRKPLYMAYTRDYNPQWEGCMELEVEAKNGTEAKKIAIKKAKIIHNL